MRNYRFLLFLRGLINNILTEKMKNFTVLFLLLFMCGSQLFSQKKKDVLLTINDEPVYVSEFKRVYNKNLDLVKDESQKSVDGYLDLFIDYKLKVAEAYAQDLDEVGAYQREYNKYRDQLSRNYLFEKQVTEDLAIEAYERGLEEINADHILITASYEDSPQDTLKAYNKIKALHDRIKKGEDFETLAKQHSEEPNAKETGGKLGYFTVFSLVYPFESMAYNTKVGEVSEIVRTRYGYHLIKVNDRRKRSPKITVSHIMITANTAERTFDPEERINELYSMLQQGEDFESIARQYSEDKNSGQRGGKLNPFSKGDLRSDEFEEAAYSLKNPGDYTKPVKSAFGYHIIRLEEKHTTPSFEDEKARLMKRVEKGDRSVIITTAINDKIKEKYGFNKENDYNPFFETFVTDEVLQRAWSFEPIGESDNKRLFTIGNRSLDYNDFAAFIVEYQKKSKPYKSKALLLSDYFDEFEAQELKNYFKDELEKENEEYAGVIDEYRNGLLIFDVMNNNVWNKAKQDSIGLVNFYEKEKHNYLWKERVDAIVVSGTDEKLVSEAQKMLKQGKNSEEIKTSLNKDDEINVIISEGVFEIGDRELPTNIEAKKGVSEVYTTDNGFTVLNINNVLPAGTKPLNSVRGRVMSDYQNYLEKTWIESLREKYDVKINKKTLKRVKKEIDS